MFSDEQCHPSDDVDLRIVQSMLRPKGCSIIMQGCVWIATSTRAGTGIVSAPPQAWRMLLSTILKLAVLVRNYLEVGA
jgi:hypothetical protein